MCPNNGNQAACCVACTYLYIINEEKGSRLSDDTLVGNIQNTQRNTGETRITQNHSTCSPYTTIYYYFVRFILTPEAPVSLYDACDLTYLCSAEPGNLETWMIKEKRIFEPPWTVLRKILCLGRFRTLFSTLQPLPNPLVLNP